MTILNMAFKDIRLIVRDRLGLFFIVFFPILMGLFFGLMISPPGQSGGGGKMRIAVVDQDNSEMSERFLEALATNNKLEIESTDVETGRDSVRRGERTGLIVIQPGFGEQAGIFWGDPPELGLGLDPSRTAESAMLEGFVMQAIGELVAQRFQDPISFRPMIEQSRQELAESTELTGDQLLLVNGFFDSIDSMIDSATLLDAAEAGESDGVVAGGGGLQFANITPIDIRRQVDPDSVAGQVQKLKSRWDISFPQAMLWGVLACIATFAISIAQERTRGTLLRLQVAPVGSGSILAGKALACFLTTMAVIVMLIVFGVLLGMKPGSYPKLVAAAICVAGAFTGIMMVISLLGRTEQGVSGAGWAVNMVMAMIGGAMIPTMFMPELIRQFSVISPVRWAIQAIEGAVWREFSWAEMMVPLGILVAVGSVCFVIGTVMLKRQTNQA